ncbi:MAG TPA: bifunctional phosphopantothenoylcysteine decarboxylase/phosphopantothenate--cysteine ligase CoaBC [Methanoculleus sp.]|nr:bifunctional phosphopantothenoylcysteine decarboxylase/phosphopantothenate--cysteine ligase CoaBC [Methanoculleus sp.]
MTETTGPLDGRTVVLGITGSIAAVETVLLAHALRRRGAAVQGVMSTAAAGILHPDAVAYATGRPAITRCTGMVEHVAFCGIAGEADVLLIAPCTANTLCKMAHGIDDTPVTTFATTAIGRGMPVIVVPAMHHSMFRHPGVAACLETLRRWGVTVIDPRIEEQKAKIAAIEEIVLHVERAASGMPLAGKQVLITSGACREPVDDVRVLTTRSTGMMGRELALQAFRLGAEVTVVHAGSIPCVRNVAVQTAVEMREAVMGLLDAEHFDYYLSAAAISDFVPERSEGKIPSGQAVTLRLAPSPKLIDAVAGREGLRTVAFKLGWDGEAKAQSMLDAGAALVVVNTPDAMGADAGAFVILSAAGRRDVTGTKEEVAAAVWSELQ